VTGIPKRRYYVVLIILMVGSVFAFGAMFYYVRAKDQAAVVDQARQIAAQSDRYDYRSCLDRNELRSVMYVILQGALERPAPPAATPAAREQERAYRALIRSYLVGGELTPQDCEQILRREGHP
jgi:nitrate/nitrite-specific signal transduction histidine kinase